MLGTDHPHLRSASKDAFSLDSINKSVYRNSHVYGTRFFTKLFAFLGSLSKMFVKTKSETVAEFDMTSTPKPEKAKAFLLLGPGSPKTH